MICVNILDKQIRQLSGVILRWCLSFCEFLVRNKSSFGLLKQGGNFSRRVIMFLFCFLLAVGGLSAESLRQKEIRNIARTDIKGAIVYADSLLSEGEEPQSEILHELGVMNLNLNNPDAALFYFAREKEWYHPLRDKEYLALVLIRMAEAHIYKENQAKSLSMLLDALAISKDLGDKTLEAKFYHVFALLYAKLDDNKQCLGYLKRAQVLQEEKRDTISLSETYNDLGVTYIWLNVLDSALLYLNKSLAINEMRGDFLPVSVNLSNLVGVYRKKGAQQKELDSYRKTIAIKSRLGILKARTSLDFAFVLMKLGRTKEAEQYRKMTLVLLKGETRPLLLARIYKGLSKLALQDKSYQDVIFYQHKLDSLSELRRHHEAEEKLALVNKQYKLKRQEVILERKLAINRRNKLLFGSLSLLLLSLGVFLVQENRNAKMESQKEKVILEQKVLSSQMNPHFIYNTLSAIQSSLLENDPLASSDNLSHFAKLIRQNFELVAKKKITLEDDLEVLVNYIETQRFRLSNSFDYEIHVDEDIDAQLIELPPLLLQPFVENAIEHGLKDLEIQGFLRIDISKKGDSICFKIIDNGVGLESSTMGSGQLHALDIFKQRIALNHKDDVKTFSLSDKSGETVAQFCLTV